MNRRDLLKAFLAANPITAQACFLAGEYGLPDGSEFTVFDEFSIGCEEPNLLPFIMIKVDCDKCEISYD